MIVFKIVFLVLLTVSGQAFLGFDLNHRVKAPLKELTHELIPITKTIFNVVDLKTGSENIVDLTGENFILVSVREKGSDGRFYAVDSDGTVWWSGVITSGTPEFRSPSGIFPIIQKERYYMSKDFPEENGINNMDYMMKFTPSGHALHKGSVNSNSFSWVDGISMRVLDKNFVTPVLRKYNLLKLNADGFMPKTKPEDIARFVREFLGKN